MSSSISPAQKRYGGYSALAASDPRLAARRAEKKCTPTLKGRLFEFHGYFNPPAKNNRPYCVNAPDYIPSLRGQHPLNLFAHRIVIGIAVQGQQFA